MSEKEGDIFDDLDALKAPGPEVERAPIAVVVAPSGPLKSKPFGMLGLEFAEELGGTTCVVVHLAYQMKLSGSKPVPATAIRTGCNDKRIRRRVLRLLEKLGRAEIEWRGRGVAPLVKLKHLDGRTKHG
jgi:hypothetical protein